MYKLTWKDVWKELTRLSFILAPIGFILGGRGGAVEAALIPFILFTIWTFGDWFYS